MSRLGLQVSCITRIISFPRVLIDTLHTWQLLCCTYNLHQCHQCRVGRCLPEKVGLFSGNENLNCSDSPFPIPHSPFTQIQLHALFVILSQLCIHVISHIRCHCSICYPQCTSDYTKLEWSSLLVRHGFMQVIGFSPKDLVTVHSFERRMEAWIML